MASVSTEWPVEREDAFVSEGTVVVVVVLLMVGARLGAWLGGFALMGIDSAQELTEELNCFGGGLLVRFQ